MYGAERLTTTVGIRLTTNQASKLRDLAAADDRPPSTLARRMLADALAKYETPKIQEVSVT